MKAFGGAGGAERPGWRRRRWGGLGWALVRRVLGGAMGVWVARVVVAIPGVVLMVSGVGSSDPGRYKIWHDGGLAFLVVAGTLPVWRRVRRGVDGAVRWREVLRRGLRRVSVGLVVGAVGCLVGFRYFSGRGAVGTAHVMGAVGVWLVVVAVVLPLLEPVLWAVFPGGVRRVERTARLVAEIDRAAGVGVGAGGRRLAEDFDAGVGASGRPKAFVEHVRVNGVSGSGEKVGMRSGGVGGVGAGVAVDWDGACLVVSGGAGRGRKAVAYPVVGSGEEKVWGRGVVAEMVSFDARDRIGGRLGAAGLGRVTRLVFVDARGRRVLTVRPFAANWSQAVGVAKAAGVSYSYYRVDARGARADRILRMMFPSARVVGEPGGSGVGLVAGARWPRKGRGWWDGRAGGLAGGGMLAGEG